MTNSTFKTRCIFTPEKCIKVFKPFVFLLSFFLNTVSAQTVALDPTFNGNGKVTKDLGSQDIARGMAIQSDGKIVIAGKIQGNGPDFGLLRYNTNGTLDVTFGVNGIVSTDFGAGSDDNNYAVAIDANGKIVTVGQSNSPGSYQIAIARYNIDGSLDGTFGTGGKVTTNFLDPYSEIANAVAIQSDGKIVVGGTVYDGSQNVFLLARYETTGALDLTFDTDGIVTTAFGITASLYSLAIQSDGKIVAGGESFGGSNYDFALARYTSTGALDVTFDTDGKLTTDFGSNDRAYSVALQNDGKIVAAGYNTISTTNFAVARYLSDGTLDNTFDTDGKVTTDFGSNANDQARSVAIQTDGQIVVAGYGTTTGGYRNFGVVRYNSTDGSLDNSFDGDGIITTNFTGTSFNDEGFAVALSGLRIYVAGTSTGDFAVAAYVTTFPPKVYFRTKQNGNWNDVNTWESSTDDLTFTTGLVSPATHTPDFNDNAISISHTVNLTANVTTDQTTVASGGALIVDPNVVLTINQGSGVDLTVASGGSMTIRSTAAGTGSIGNSSTATTSGDVTVERYISSSGNRAYRLLGPSVNTSASIKPFIRDNWQEGVNNPNTSSNLNPVATYGTHITGSQTGQNGFDATISGQGSLFTFNQNTNLYEAALNTNATNLNAKTGYLLFVRGDRSIDLNSNLSPLPSSNTTLRATGTLLTGTIIYNGLAPNPGGGADEGFSLVTNPYASAINWNLLYTRFLSFNDSYFENYYTYVDPNIGDRGGYVTVTSGNVRNINTAGVNGTTDIQSGQAFFIKTKATFNIAVLTIKELDKSTTNNIDVFRTAAAAQKFTASLFFNSATLGRRIADGVTALYDNTYNAALDGNDAIEIANFDENIAITRGSTHLSIEERPIITAAQTMPLFISNMKQKAYEWEFNPTNFAPNMVAQLVDKFTGTNTYLNINAVTVVPFTVTAAAGSSASDRFYIQFSPSVALPVTLSSVKAYQKNSGVQVEWIIQTENNMDRYEVERSANGQTFTTAGNVKSKGNSNVVVNYNFFDAVPLQGVNFYRIKSVDKNGKITYSDVAKVNISSAAKNAVTISPNPVAGSSVAIQINLPKGTYTFILTNKLGQQLANKVVQHAGGITTETLEPSANFAAGIYQLKVKGNGINVTEQVIKK